MPEIQQLNQRIERLERMINFLILSDRYYFQRDIDLMNGVNIRVSKLTGTKIGTSATDKLSVYGVTPVVQAASINAPSTSSAAYVQIEAQSTVNAVNSIRAALANFGITA